MATTCKGWTPTAAQVTRTRTHGFSPVCALADAAGGGGLNNWTPSGSEPVCEDLRPQGGTSTGCWANDKDAVQAAGVEVDDMRWEIAAVASISLDADLSDWDGVPYKAQTPFRDCDKHNGELCTSPFVEFDLCNVRDGTATWTGITDHSAAIAFA